MSSDQPTRKRVKPAHPGACIPDPAHPGLDLAQDGTEVTWDHYWIARERRGEIIVIADVSQSAAAPAGQPGASAPSAGVSFMITKAQREQLGQRGFTAEQIASMTPEAAHIELEKPAPTKAD